MVEAEFQFLHTFGTNSTLIIIYTCVSLKFIESDTKLQTLRVYIVHKCYPKVIYSNANIEL